MQPLKGKLTGDLSWLILVIFLFACGCSQGKSDGSGGSEPGVSDALLPNEAKVIAKASVAFNAEGIGTDPADLIWYVNDIEGGSSELGFVQSGVYTAPALRPEDPIVEVRCRSKVDPRATAAATVQITSPWVKIYGGAEDDRAASVREDFDGNYVLAGHTGANGWVFELDPDGNMLWETAYSGASYFTAIVPIEDGGCLAAGQTQVLRITSDGNLVWSKELPYAPAFPGHDIIGIEPAQDGGFILASDYMTGGGGYVPGRADIVKLNLDGSITWRSVLQGPLYAAPYGYRQDGAFSVAQASDGGYVFAGWLGDSARSYLYEFYYCQPGSPSYPCPPVTQYRGLWVTKLRPDGSPIWAGRFGDVKPPHAVVRRIPAGGLILLVQTDRIGSGSVDFWILRLADDGQLIWQHTYGGSGADRGYDIKPTADGGFIAVGETESYGYGGNDILILKLDAGGALQWQKTYGGTGSEQAFWVEQSSDGGYMVAGRTNSFGNGGFDALVLKLDSFGEVSADCRLAAIPAVTMQAAAVARDAITAWFESVSTELREAPLDAGSTDSSVQTLCGLP